MHNHYSASGIASDAQRYLNQGIIIDTTTTLDFDIIYAHKTQRSDKANCRPNEPDQLLADIKQQLLR